MRKRVLHLRFVMMSIMVFFLLAGMVTAVVASSAGKITHVDARMVKDTLMLEVKGTTPLEYRTMMVNDPRRSFVIDILNAELTGKKKEYPLNLGVVEKVRVAQFSSNPDIVRIVVDVKAPVKSQFAFLQEKKVLTARITGETSVALETSKAEPSIPVKEQAAEKKLGTTQEAKPVMQKETLTTTKEEVSRHVAPKQVAEASTRKADVMVKPVQMAKLETPPVVKKSPAHPVPSVELASMPSHPRTTMMASARTKKPAAKPKVAAAPRQDLVSVELKDAELQDVIRLLASKTGTNIVIDSGVQGKVTVKLTDVPLENALQLILSTQGYGYRQVGNVIVVASPDRLDKFETMKRTTKPVATQVIPLENARASDVAKNIQSTNPEAKVEVDSRLNALIVTAPVDSIRSIKGLVSQLDVAPPPPTPLTTEVLQLSYTSAKDVVAQMKGLVDPSAIVVDDRLNSLIVTGRPGLIDSVKGFVAAVDVPSPQVMLEMKVLDVNEKGTKLLGVDWGASSKSNWKEVGGVGGKGPNTGTDNMITATPIDTPGATATAGQGFAGFGFQTFVRDSFKFATTINYLLQNSLTKILANPRIATMNKKEATIHIGERIPLVYYDPRAGLYQAQYIDVGVVLKVTPVITPDGYVEMKLNPQVSEPGEFIQNFPRIKTRSAETYVRVKNGETIVIGGLLRENYQQTVTRVPLLSDIPVLGELFKNTSKTKDKTDLLITVTPRVVANQ